MLNDNRIHELELLTKVGKDAQETLTRYNLLLSRLEKLNYILDGNCNKCYSIDFNNGYSTQSLRIEKVEECAHVMKTIIKIEIEHIKEQLETFK